MNPFDYGLTTLTRLAVRRRGAKECLRQAMVGRLPTIIETVLAVAVESGDPIGQVVTSVAADEGYLALFEHLVSRLNEPELQESVPLSELALLANQRLLESQRKRGAGLDAEEKAELAVLCRDIALRLAALGRSHEALSYDLESVEMFRSADLEGHALELASSLNNLSNRLAQIGRNDEALAVSIEAAEAFERIERAQPGVYLSLFAQSLHNMASRLRDVGYRDRALLVMDWAIERRRFLFVEEGGRYRANLATSLDGKGVILSELGKADAAAVVLAEAIEHWRWLAEVRPDAHKVSLARTLSTLSSILASQEKLAEGVVAASEAVDIYRRLAEERPSTFTGDLARALVNAGQGIGATQGEAGLAHLLEATRLFQRLAEQAPEVYLRPWLSSRVLAAGLYLALGDLDKTFDFLEPSQTRQRELVEGGEGEVRASPALCLHTRALASEQLGKMAAAEDDLQETIKIQTELAEERGTLFQPLLEKSRRDLARVRGQTL